MRPSLAFRLTLVALSGTAIVGLGLLGGRPPVAAMPTGGVVFMPAPGELRGSIGTDSRPTDSERVLRCQALTFMMHLPDPTPWPDRWRYGAHYKPCTDAVAAAGPVG